MTQPYFADDRRLTENEVEVAIDTITSASIKIKHGGKMPNYCKCLDSIIYKLRSSIDPAYGKPDPENGPGYMNLENEPPLEGDKT